MRTGSPVVVTCSCPQLQHAARTRQTLLRGEFLALLCASNRNSRLWIFDLQARMSMTGKASLGLLPSVSQAHASTESASACSFRTVAQLRVVAVWPALPSSAVALEQA